VVSPPGQDPLGVLEDALGEVVSLKNKLAGVVGRIAERRQAPDEAMAVMR